MFKALFALLVTLSPLAAQEHGVPHYDHRQTPHLLYPADTAKTGAEGEAQAYAYLSSHAAVFGLPQDLANLELVREQTSLLATHYTYRQLLNGLPVRGGELVVSIDHDQQRVSRVYNNTYPVTESVPLLSSKQILDEEDAFDVAWTNLEVSGELMAEPAARLVYLPENTSFRLVWVTDLAVDAPFGYWESTVDALTGKVIAVRESSLTRKPTPPRSFDEALTERTGAFARFQARQSAPQAKTNKRADGTGLVFDPDPRTTLNNENITDSSAASVFVPAYLTRNLLGLELSSGTYRMNGPWITIQNFESPNTAPSTTTTGNWTAVRGDNAFNDATTYFHIDQNQRYIQSLGFTGATGIQEGPISTDTDGLNGDDNSHFIPGSNQMAFGHGCVDDNEDADVILHEYGHAIHHSINDDWFGGDSGAIGEGFGDYWAGSYSYSTPNGPIFHPEWVFTWDGHSNCWPGRDLDRTDLQYDPGRTYGAHSSIPGGGQSDELWSAPVFQSLLDLIGMGETREEIDQIVLESHFGLASGVTMRILATATVAAANALQPGGPHAGVFTTRFRAQNILSNQFVAFEAGTPTLVSDSGGNGYADPNETVTFTVQLQNAGTLSASAISGTLSTTDPDVTLNTATSSYPSLASGASADNATAYSITIGPDQVCGEPIVLRLAVQWTDSSAGTTSANLTLELPIGEPQPFDQSISPGLAITDNATVTSTLAVTGTGATVTDGFNVNVDLSHTRIGDLTLTLESPAGTDIVLHNQTGGNGTAIFGNYPGTLTPVQSLATLAGENLDGDWKLHVTDHAAGATGTLSTWVLHDITGYSCLACFGDLNGDGTVDASDFGMAMSGWNDEEGDANGDGVGSIIDLIQIQAAYGACD